jgi:hypothetical protein
VMTALMEAVNQVSLALESKVLAPLHSILFSIAG